MKYTVLLSGLALALSASVWSELATNTKKRAELPETHTVEALRAAYAGPPETWPAPTIKRPDGEAEFVEMGLRPIHDAPDDPALTKLGEALFFSPVLSADETLSCASCHDPEHSFASTDRQAIGHNGMVGTRNAPGLLGLIHSPPYFWDGRAETLEDQASGPILNPIEMAATRDLVEARLNQRPEWREWIHTVTGENVVSLDLAVEAIAAYERTLDEETPFDRFLKGDQTALSDTELEGLHIFRTKGQCMSCHEGPNLSDNRFHNIGLAYYGRKYEDLGLYTETKQSGDVGRFNTPSLRHIPKTAPYMHNGLMPSLRGVVNYYNGGGARPKRKEHQLDDPLFPETSPRLEPLNLTKEEREALTAFLGTL